MRYFIISFRSLLFRILFWISFYLLFPLCILVVDIIVMLGESKTEILYFIRMAAINVMYFLWMFSFFFLLFFCCICIVKQHNTLLFKGPPNDIVIERNLSISYWTYLPLRATTTMFDSFHYFSVDARFFLLFIFFFSRSSFWLFFFRSFFLHTFLLFFKR